MSKKNSESHNLCYKMIIMQTFNSTFSREASNPFPDDDPITAKLP